MQTKTFYKEFAQNIHSPAEGRGKGVFRPALNDPIGNWKLIATDFASGLRAEQPFAVERESLR